MYVCMHACMYVFSCGPPSLTAAARTSSLAQVPEAIRGRPGKDRDKETEPQESEGRTHGQREARVAPDSNLGRGTDNKVGSRGGVSRVVERSKAQQGVPLI